MSRNRNFENLINLSVRYLILKQQDTFDDEEKISELRELPMHIYLICRSPKILLDTTKSYISEDKIELNFYTNLKGVREDFLITSINRNDQKISKIECSYPYNNYSAFLEDGNLLSEGKTNLLFKFLCIQNDLYYNVSNLEVLYVGQAFNEDGTRITVDRLSKHEKAQRIYFDTQNKYPDHEVWFLSLTFDPNLITVFDSKTYYNPENMEEDAEHVAKIESTPIPFDQQITILEAALITYFGTSEFNKEYLNFPSRKHKSYKDIYDLDFNSVGFELSTEQIFSKLYSKNVEANYLHYKKYFLHDDSER